MTTDAPGPQPVWRAWLTAVLSTLYLVAFVTLALDLPPDPHAGTDASAIATRPAAPAGPARAPAAAPRRAPVTSPLPPPRVADLTRARAARPASAPAPGVVAERAVAPSRARTPRRPSRRIRTRSS